MQWLFVFIGGGLGSSLRWYFSNYNTNFPSGTLIANALSCLVLGFLVGLSLKNDISTNYKLLLMTGFCGGFSTFSTFSAEVFAFLKDAQYTYAIAYVLGSLVLGLVCIAIGISLQKTFL